MSTTNLTQETSVLASPENGSHPACAEGDLPAVAEHACYLFYAVKHDETSLPEDLSLTLGGLVPTPSAATNSENSATEHSNKADRKKADKRLVFWVRPEALKSIAGQHVHKPVWKQAPLQVGIDLHPYIRRLLGTGGVDADKAHARAFRLTDESRRLVQGRPIAVPKNAPADERQPVILEFDLRQSARDRVAHRLGNMPSCSLQLQIQDMRLVFFRTGQAVAIVEVIFKRSDDAPLHPCWAVEGVYSLAQFNRLRWCATGGAPEHTPAFGLGSVVRDLAGDVEGAERAKRVFTATFVKFAETPAADALRRLAVQLSRHYTDDYDLRDLDNAAAFVHDFEGVLHAFALEGSATIVVAAPRVGGKELCFLRDYKTGSYETHYLPIILLGFHEFVTLLDLSSDSGFWPELEDPKRDPIADLEEVRDRVLKFRLCYRFSHVSYIHMHNAVNRALRKILELDRMLEELSRDAREIDGFLQETAAKRTEARFRWVGMIAAAGLAWLMTFTIVKEILGVLHWEQGAGIAGVGVGVVSAVVAWWVAWTQGRVGHRVGSGHFARDAAHELARHRALRSH